MTLLEIIGVAVLILLYKILKQLHWNGLTPQQQQDILDDREWKRTWKQKQRMYELQEQAKERERQEQHSRETQEIEEAHRAFIDARSARRKHINETGDDFSKRELRCITELAERWHLLMDKYRYSHADLIAKLDAELNAQFVLTPEPPPSEA